MRPARFHGSTAKASLIGDLDARGIIRLLRERYQPKDVLAQQQKFARAEALAFVAPVHFLNSPAILKGWPNASSDPLVLGA
jgi:putative NADPH-quinone reductase